MSSNDLQQIRNSSASYYIIGSYTLRHVSGSSRVWCERLKVITLPRHLVVNANAPRPYGATSHHGYSQRISMLPFASMRSEKR